MLIHNSPFHGPIKKSINRNPINVDITNKLDYTIASSYLALDVTSKIVSNCFPVKGSKNKPNESIMKNSIYFKLPEVLKLNE